MSRARAPRALRVGRARSVVVVHRGHLRSSAASRVRRSTCTTPRRSRIHARARRMARSYPWRRVARSSHEEARWRSASVPGDRPTRPCWSTSTGWSARTTRSGRTRPTRPSASRSGRPGHRGSSLNGAFNEAHIAATTEAICRYRDEPGHRRPAVHRHGPARPVRAGVRDGARGSSSRTASTSGSMPPTATRRPRSISHAILVHNRGRARPPGRRHRRHPVAQPARGRRLQVQPAQRRPGRHGRHQLDPGRGEPAARGRTSTGVRRVPVADARAADDRPRLRRRPTSTTSPRSSTWTRSAASGLRLGVDPLGGASVAYWPAIGERYGLDLTVTNDVVDPQFAFMTCDWDGRIRMDPSSPYAMARLVELRDRFDVAFGNDTDADRHGIVTPGRRPDEPEPLPVRRGRPPVRRRPRLGRRTWPSARRWSRAR